MKIYENLEILDSSQGYSIFINGRTIETVKIKGAGKISIVPLNVGLDYLNGLAEKYPSQKLFVNCQSQDDWSELTLIGEREETEKEKSRRVKDTKTDKVKKAEKLKKRALSLQMEVRKIEKEVKVLELQYLKHYGRRSNTTTKGIARNV